jgi:hypothetical protein
MEIKIKTSMIENDHSYQGFILGNIENNMITYEEEKINVALIFESDKITLLRETDEYKLELIFIENNTSKSVYLLKENNVSIPLEINTSLLKINSNEIVIKYKINTKEEEAYFRLEYEVLK